MRLVINIITQSLLSNELAVACEIHHFNVHDEGIWHDKLVKSLRGKVARNKVGDALKALTNHGITITERGETNKDRHTNFYIISSDYKSVITALYEKFWRDYRESKV
jgi:hypothetical protein